MILEHIKKVLNEITAANKWKGNIDAIHYIDNNDGPVYFITVNAAQNNSTKFKVSQSFEFRKLLHVGAPPDLPNALSTFSIILQK
jgi:hypothetical protein